jgi:hypothetical protein
VVGWWELNVGGAGLGECVFTEACLLATSILRLQCTSLKQHGMSWGLQLFASFPQGFDAFNFQDIHLTHPSCALSQLA